MEADVGEDVERRRELGDDQGGVDLRVLGRRHRGGRGADRAEAPVEHADQDLEGRAGDHEGVLKLKEVGRKEDVGEEAGGEGRRA